MRLELVALTSLEDHGDQQGLRRWTLVRRRRCPMSRWECRRLLGQVGAVL